MGFKEYWTPVGIPVTEAVMGWGVVEEGPIGVRVKTTPAELTGRTVMVEGEMFTREKSSRYSETKALVDAAKVELATKRATMECAPMVRELVVKVAWPEVSVEVPMRVAES